MNPPSFAEIRIMFSKEVNAADEPQYPFITQSGRLQVESALSLRQRVWDYRSNYPAHRITDAVTEGLDATLQWIQYSSRRFRSHERFTPGPCPRV
jgi:hypothetical protein